MKRRSPSASGSSTVTARGSSSTPSASAAERSEAVRWNRCWLSVDLQCLSPYCVGPGHDFEEMAIRVLKIYAPTTIVLVNLAGAALTLTGLCPIWQPAITDTAQDLVEFVFAYEKRIVL